MAKRIDQILTERQEKSHNWELLIGRIVDRPENIAILDPLLAGFEPAYKQEVYRYLLEIIQKAREGEGVI